MGKRKEENQQKESIEEKVFKKYRKYKRDNNSGEELEQSDQSNNLIDETTESDLKINENDSISAEKIFKKVKKIKDKNTKNAIKLRKQSRKLLAKTEAEEESQQNTGNKSLSAITYLNDWKYKRNDWKFKKTLQIWLMKNWKNINKITDKDFDLFIEYIFAINSESFAKKRLETEAKELIDKQTEEKDKEDEEHEKLLERARRILQCY